MLLHDFKNLLTRKSKAKPENSGEKPEIPLMSGVRAGTSKSGVTVSTEQAMTLDSVMSCVNVLAQSVAALPIDLFIREDAGGSSKAKGHPVYRLIKFRPNPEMTSYEFRYWMMTDALLRGCGYAQIIRDEKTGSPIELWPLLAAKVMPFRNDQGQLWFSYDDNAIPDADILRVQVIHHGGVIGKSIVQLQAATLGLAKAQEDSAGEFFSNGLQSNLIINIPKTTDQAGFDRLGKSIRAYKTMKHQPLVLEEGVIASPLQVNAQETQLLESRKYTRSVIAGLFRVPAHFINDLEKATFSNIEHQDLSFAKHTLTPWLTNWEQRLAVSLLTPDEQDTHYFKFNLNSLVRGDMNSRYSAYSQAVNAGIMSPNEIRALEDLPAYEGGDVKFVQGGLRPTDAPYGTSTAA